MASVGLPQRIYQQAVTKMHVKSNHNGIEDVAANDNTVSGWIEFSPYDYDRAGSNSAAPANYGEPFDWNDTLSESGSYGCMQVFRKAPTTGRPAQVLFAYNNWRSATSEAEFGIGNFAQHFNCNNSYHTEYWTGVGGTLAKMAPDQYSVKTIGSNGYAYWESYVLGLDPMNETSKFLATIRMEGQKPVVEYSPTNEALKASGAIKYVLQGKSALSNDWQNVEFAEPGATNRFFRVKATW